ncbi:HEAT repeat domain-containing protein [Methanofollis ethanolicus]|uniref:HEAT repeat domain-containing protein n=1 Tax=Methanofollis ethanolicus TaxID=488124 RepID=UPI000831AF07|nr:HEAT repeat domain-containing protein [Methanofollis ethanolicus]
MTEITGIRPVLLALACAGSFALDGILHADPVAGAVYPHLFYLPIVLAALWYGRVSVPVAGALALVHVLVWSFAPAAVLRAGIFLAVGLLAALIAVMAAAPVPAPEGGARDLAPLLRSRSPERRYGAAVSLGRTGDPAAVPALEKALSDPDPGVRWMALEALGAIGNPALPVLTRLLGSDDIDLRWGAAVTLGDIGDPAAVEPLARALEDGDRYVRTRAALALAALGVPALPSLAAAAGHRDAGVRWAAALALGKIGSPDSIPALSPLVSDTDPAVRWKAVEALGAIGGEAAVGPLVMALDDRDEEVCGVATAALTAIGEPAVTSLIDALRTKGRWFRAVSALREMGTAAAPALSSALSRKNRWVRIGAAMVLAEEGDRQGTDALVAALSDADPDVREAAREILEVGLKKGSGSFKVHNSPI